VTVVACSEEIQIERLMKRTGMTGVEAQAITRAQMPLPEKIKRADHMVWNNGPRSALAEQAQLLVNLWTKQ
jgi:dephospho-CoA kinase